MTLSTVPRLGLPSADRALYNPSRVMPVSRARCIIPRARAMLPSADLPAGAYRPDKAKLELDRLERLRADALTALMLGE